MGIRVQDIGGILIGGGVLTLGGWLLYREYINAKLLQEFMEKVERAENAYRNALEQEDYEEAEKILKFYDARMKEEEEVIKSRGIFDSLTDLLGKAGIVCGAVAGIYVIKWLTKRFPPPPPYKCPHCGASFYTLKELEEHLRTKHPLDDAKVPNAQAAYSSLPGWVKGLISAYSGVAEWMLEESWVGLPRWQLVAIAAAAAVLLALLWWLSPWIGGIGTIANMLKPIPITA